MAESLRTGVNVGEVADIAVNEDVDEEGEEEEDEYEEPVLKYSRFNKELVKQLGPPSSEDEHTQQNDMVELISCVAVHSKASMPCSCMLHLAQLTKVHWPQ